MEKQTIYDLLMKQLKNSSIKVDEPMKQHTNFKIGGNADIYVVAKTVEDIKQVSKFAKENAIPLTIIGNGSNVLVADKGIRGIVLKIALDDIEIQKEKEYAIIQVGAGVPLGKLAQILLKEGIGSFEFAAGIPGSIGGAIRMNAGAYGGEIKDSIKKVTYMNQDNEIISILGEDCQFSYRHSFFSKGNMIILNATIQLPYTEKQNIQNKMEEYARSRKEKQPIEFPSEGSTFKRGEDFITAKLIDECGLKGCKIGDAQVSTKHAGFVVNLGNATAKDVLELIEHIKSVIKEKTGKIIELEIELLGEF